MFTLFIILAAIASILLILIVFIQNPKGGGVMANFSAANQIAGVKKTNDIVEKGTWGLAIFLVIFTLGSQFMNPQGGETTNSFLENAKEAQSSLPAVEPVPSPDEAKFQEPVNAQDAK